MLTNTCKISEKYIKEFKIIVTAFSEGESVLYFIL